MNATAEDRRRSPLQTVDRALQVLLSYSERRTQWSVTELAEEFSLDKSTAQRLLAALAARGFLRADPDTRRYTLGPTMWRMALLWERTGGLARLADPVVLRLAEDTGAAAAFAIPDGTHVRCVAAADGSDGPLRSSALVGDLYPAHAGATSRAYFAFIGPTERRALLWGRPMGRFTDRTEVDVHALEERFAETERLGYASSEGEYDENTRALAVPVMLGRRPVGSLTVGQSVVEHPGTTLADHLPRLLSASLELTDLLGQNSAAVRRRRPTITRRGSR
ncbi:IclR family transcriptional regulator [Ruania alba]|uniref:DNA-binding transcriptional regulator, IclR family n=1 Tax=Ruania alba TaxID=648782 RepID=A0A1H5NFU6_9MICO|nr:IclR family transcriptional regulator [Ruania alba]SEF00330.1 DNA-binding transcriptional regulator, IclR family [Ruania alba]